MPEPKTIRYWITKGYNFSSLSNCPACGIPVEIWISPVGAEIFLDPKDLETHFSSCSKAHEYRVAQRLKEGSL